jgi:hypothetical protein
MKTTKLSPLLSAAIALAAITLSFALRSHAQTESVLHNFPGSWQGGLPLGGL